MCVTPPERIESLTDLARFWGRPPTALVVDDNVEFLKMFGDLLSRLGFVITLVETHKEAMLRYTEARSLFKPSVTSLAPFDITFIDQLLPDGDGIELAIQIRTLHSIQPIVIITGASIHHNPQLGIVGVWFKGSGPPMLEELRNMCIQLRFPVAK